MPTKSEVDAAWEAFERSLPEQGASGDEHKIMMRAALRAAERVRKKAKRG